MPLERKQNFPEVKTKMKQSKSTNSGFSIIEVIVALFVLIVMFLLYGAASNSVILNRDARQKELALRILVSEIEDLRATDFSSLPASGALSNPLLNLLPSASLTLTISDVDANFKKAIVSISWKDASSFNSRQMELSTYISNQGL